MKEHKGWINDINETQNATVNYPIIDDSDRKISLLYDMIHPNASETLTVRSVFIIDSAKKVLLILLLLVVILMKFYVLYNHCN